MKTLMFALLIVMANTVLFPEDTKKDFTITPFLNYEYLSFQKQRIHSPGEGILFSQGNLKPSPSEMRDSLFIAGFFKQFFVQEDQPDYSNLYHRVEIMADRRINNHNFLGVFEGKSDKPLYGGLQTFNAGLAYGYEFIRNENISLTLGAGLFVGDFGIEMPNGGTLPVIPLPIIRFNMETALFDLSFDFYGDPELKFALFPKNRLRLTNTFRINQQLRDIRDLRFDSVFMYRLFSEESKLGDFAGIGLGVKNDARGFNLGEKDKSYELIFNSFYGVIDLSFLELKGGYSFNAKEIYESNTRKDIGNGFFISLMLGWQF
jgi:hypothetical protein